MAYADDGKMFFYLVARFGLETHTRLSQADLLFDESPRPPPAARHSGPAFQRPSGGRQDAEGACRLLRWQLQHTHRGSLHGSM